MISVIQRGVNRFKPMSIYIFSVLICTGSKRKWRRSLCSSQSHTQHCTLPRLRSTSLSFTSLYPTLPHSDSPIGLSTASLPPQGQSTSLYHSTFSPFHCNNPKFAAGSSLTLALMAHPIRGMCPSLCTCASQASAAVQAHCLSHRHIFPPLSKALECVHCTFIAGAGFNIHLVFLAFGGNL